MYYTFNAVIFLTAEISKWSSVINLCVFLCLQSLEVLLRHPEDNRNQIRELAQTLMDGGVLDELIQQKLDAFNTRWDELMARVRHTLRADGTLLDGNRKEIYAMSEFEVNLYFSSSLQCVVHPLMLWVVGR